MKFKTMTSEYEITADADGMMMLEKVALLPGCRSVIPAGQKFYARRGDAALLKRSGMVQLLFGPMNTSHIEDSTELEKWLIEQRAN